MKCIPTREAVGHVLCHDMTQIIKDQYKDARFRKGHVVTEEDIPVLLSMGKENLYVWEMTPGMVHEDDAAERLAALCENDHMTRSAVKEGKIELSAACDGLFRVRSQALMAVNSLEDIMIATRHGNTPVRKGDKLAGTRVIPLVIAEEQLRAAEAAAGDAPLLELLPYIKTTAVIVATGGEVRSGLIQDTFTPVVRDKLAAYGIETLSVLYSGDGVDNVAEAIAQARSLHPELILCTGGMSVDPDDNTPGGIRRSGARIVTYGAPVLPGAMFLLGYYEDGTVVCGLPGCVMYAGATIFDLVLPRIAAGVEVTRGDIVSLGEGGLCLGCKPCRYPICPFGKSVLA
ncbi:MAG: molybdopterin-binding protein [Oscillibacter sp.]|nr:molybdopterin-binding protein [Oscillibacter sp.]